MVCTNVHFSLLTSLLNFATVRRIQFHPALSLCRPVSYSIALRYVNLVGLNCGEAMGMRRCGTACVLSRERLTGLANA